MGNLSNKKVGKGENENKTHTNFLEISRTWTCSTKDAPFPGHFLSFSFDPLCCKGNKPVGFFPVFMQRANIFSSTVGAVQSVPPFLLTAVKGSLLHVVGSFDWLDLYKAMSDEAMINS